MKIVQGRWKTALKCLAIPLLLLAMSRGQVWIFTHYLAIDRPATALSFLGLWSAAAGCTCLAALSSRRAIRWTWALILGAAGIVTHAYVAISGGRLDWFAFETLRGETNMAGAIVQTYGSTLVGPVLLGLGLAWAVALPPVWPRWNSRWLALAPLLPILLVFKVFAGTNGNGIKGLPAPYNLLGLVPGLVVNAVPEHDPAVAESIVGLPRARNILIIVDESVRGDFIDFENPRGVTPYLHSVRRRAIDFGIASSATNISSSSNAILRMGANPATLSGGPDIRGNPTVWQYARKAGFRTVYIDCQGSRGAFTNFMNASERKLIDDFIQLDGPQERRDFEAIPIIARLMKEPGRHFIYFNKYGAHFPYQTAYPKTEAVFSPHLEDWEGITDRARMANSYRNAVRWSVDAFFRRFDEQADLRDAFVLYTSDHGQNLLDDGVALTHGRSHKPISEEATVPLFAFAADERLASQIRKAARLNRNRANGFQIFPTLLAVMGYDPAAVRAAYYLTLFDPVPGSVGFASGGIFPVFGGKPEWNAFRAPGS